MKNTASIGATQPNVASPARAQNVFLKTIGVVSLLAIIYIHYLDLPGKLAETPYLGYGYILLMLGCAVAAGLLLFNRAREGWILGGALALGAFVAYVVNRTAGLPLAMDDIGNWGEPLGVYSLVAEGTMMAASAWALSRLQAARFQSSRFQR